MRSFTWTVESLDVDACCMIIRYSAENRQDVDVGIRIPFTDQSMADVVLNYAPFSIWDEVGKTRQSLSVGDSGVYTYVESVQPGV